MKKKLSLIGMYVGIVAVILGILAICGAFGSAGSYGSSSPYDSGFASFGGDYYTYSVNNAAEAVSATRAVATNLRQISAMLQHCLGFFLICFGLMGFCGFGIVYAGCTADKTSQAEINTILDEELSEEDEKEQENEASDESDSDAQSEILL